VSRKPKFYAVYLKRLVPRCSRYDSSYWVNLQHPVYVFSTNKREAVVAAVKAIEKFPVYQKIGEDRVEIKYKLSDIPEFDPELNWYLFWARHRGHHWVVQAKTKDRAARQLRRIYGKPVYNGWVISVKLAEEPREEDSAYQDRLNFSLTLCNQKPPNTSIVIESSITKSSPPKCPLCFQQLLCWEYCCNCGWDKSYGQKDSPHIDKLSIS